MSHTHGYDLVSGNLDQILTFKSNGSFLRCQQSGYSVQDRCLTGTVGADQCNDLTFIYMEGHTLYGLYHAVIYFDIIYL